jgi:hypothetical protein
MKSIANLAAVGPAPKKRRKGGDGQCTLNLIDFSRLELICRSCPRDYADDGFGKTDDDWAIYREIVRCRTSPPLSVLICSSLTSDFASLTSFL